ncbi:hypothetical protein Pan216_58050 [Planctomycetes bacterium Pan216]|uniref:Uncharacterized protein n=1 Tax=Kolteria novifilia TaxID=2527975 RepID=A0A518BD56_9BACT|nr:hypothetical protein Pan216_58050 [Planctomycetes bacterium Pan216]
MGESRMPTASVGMARKSHLARERTKQPGDLFAADYERPF